MVDFKQPLRRDDSLDLGDTREVRTVPSTSTGEGERPAEGEGAIPAEWLRNRTPTQGPRKPCGCLESDHCLHGLLDDGLAPTGGPDDGYRGIPREETPVMQIGQPDVGRTSTRESNLQPRDPAPDVTCTHGLALDMHCCACGRSGFFPPPDCTCRFDQPRAGDEDLTAALEGRPREAAGSEVQLWDRPWPIFTYLAGAAGSGKTFAMKAAAARQSGLLLCATTGIAAINLGGTTINAQLGYFDTKSLQEKWLNGFLAAQLGKLWKAGVKRLVLDEVSMLDGDQLTSLAKAIEEVNGRGYVLKSGDGARNDAGELPSMGLTLVGDFCQLPPVKAPFAFESTEWAPFGEHTITLTEIRRQADPAFIEALRAARRGDARGALAFFGPQLQTETDDRFEGPTLLAKNESVDRYNWLRLNRLTGQQVIFSSSREGKQRSEWGNPDKPPNTWGIPPRLSLKIGALVMILANKRYPMSASFEYVNGDLGELIDADEEHHIAYVTLQRTGDTVLVDYVRREVLIPLDAARRKELIALGEAEKIAEGGKWEIAGWISYMPLRVAYASTVHKSQGLSLDRVQVNIRDAFFKSPGMLYVALSRARSAQGLRLVGSTAAFIERCTVDPRLRQWL